MKAFKKWFWWIIVPAALALCVLIFTLTVNLVVVCSVRGDIGEDFSESSEVYAIVLGAKVH